MTKRKKTEKQETPPPNKTDGRSSNEQPGEESIADAIGSDISKHDENAVSGHDPETEYDETVIDPKFEVLSRGIDAWIFSRFTPFFYHLTRAFAHFQKGSSLTTQKIFQNLEWMGQGDHEKFMETLDDFKSLILEEYLEAPDGRIVPVADIRTKK